MSLVSSLTRATSALGRLRTAANSTGSALNTIKGRTGQADSAVGRLRAGLGTADTSLAKSKTSTDKFKTSLDHLKSSSGKAHTALRDVKRQSDAVEKSVGKAGKSATGGGKSMGGLGKGLKGATLAQKGLNTAMKANAFGLIMTLLAPIIGQFINMDKVSKALAAGVKWAWNAISGAIKSHAGPIKSIMKGLVNGFTALPRAYIGGINAMIRGLNSIHVKIPGWVPVVGGKEFGIHLPQIPNIPTLAEGGVVSARAGGRLTVIGEGGEDEAVIPLSKLSRMLGHHPGGGAALHRLAAAVEKLAERPVHVQVDSQTIARAVFLGQRQLARR
ncbi:hypothetical protein OH809_22715 [Streptomyces sp. NBC_00873]|uniref:hypothetical protein n=1 Tax=unclassified Streptomyces TaxID=2593676 RepID=UPI003870E029|nr:hypothetical protein OH809_22715 [Streptomyces sp. NBC_00873]WTA44726.1 hypothetical protein OH821_20580 [Streptomyces sp. NBC_00842]